MNRIVRRYTLLIIAVYAGIISFAQTDDALLKMHFSRLRENIPDTRKLIIIDSVKKILSEYAVSDSIFRHHFSDLRFLGQITSPDSLVKLLSWNLVLADGDNRYYCYIIRRGDKKASPSFLLLEGKYREEPPEKDKVYSAENWYGSLYYDLRPFDSGGRKYYILLGLDYGNSLVTRKIIEILYFDEKGAPRFGADCLSDGRSLSKRALFEYSSSAVMSLKFESDSLIVFDHLSPFSPDLKDNYQFYGPDFSFDAYALKNGIWYLKPDIDIKNRKK